jgi:mono/diheme cytochrome c family protein
MFRSPVLLRWRAAITAALVLWQLTGRVPLPEAGAAEEITPQSARQTAAGQTGSDTGSDVVVTDLEHEGDEAEQTVENLGAPYLAQPSDETASTEAVRQPFYLVENATEEKAGEKADNSKKPLESAGSSPKRSEQDEALISSGRGYFESSCTQCHDSERATSKHKTVSAWLATVSRMAAKEGADVPSSEHTAIATYLASLSPSNGAGSKGDSASATAEAAEPSFTLNGTLSPVYRGTDPTLENKGFFPDTWVGIEWRSKSNPVSGRVTVCASCHGINTGLGVELVEAAADVDLYQLFTGCTADKRCSRFRADLTAGRFVVPFGAFSGRVNPGALRTASLPLMYDMGRRVGPLGPGQPVINQPYSDEGADLHLECGLARDWDVTFDSYGVNGLQTGGPGVFFSSRSYEDNNSNVAAGGRATIGNKHWRFGGSVAGGELQDQGAPVQNYSLAGGDVTYRDGEFLRTYYEYAIRDEDSFPSPNSESLAFGNLIESEVLLYDKPKISFLARYDTLDHRGALGNDNTERFTYGLNWVLPGGSLLIVDHERWKFDDAWHANILAMRWTVAF